MMARRFATTGNALLAAVLAPGCAVCGHVLDAPAAGPVCEACWGRLQILSPPLCDRCGHPLPTHAAGSSSPEAQETPRSCTVCSGWPPGLLTRMRAIGPYDGVLRDLLHALKYGGRRTIAERLVPLLRHQAADVLAGVDAVVPVPLHRTRQWTRGFNQADLLARGLGPPVWCVLRRTRATPPQASLGAGSRHGNVAGAFRPRLLPQVFQQVRNRRLVLIDDVTTTGETLLACAAALREAGAADVRAAVPARTVLAQAAECRSFSRAQAAR